MSTNENDPEERLVRVDLGNGVEIEYPAGRPGAAVYNYKGGPPPMDATMKDLQERVRLLIEEKTAQMTSNRYEEFREGLVEMEAKMERARAAAMAAGALGVDAETVREAVDATGRWFRTVDGSLGFLQPITMRQETEEAMKQDEPKEDEQIHDPVLREAVEATRIRVASRFEQLRYERYTAPREIRFPNGEMRTISPPEGYGFLPPGALTVNGDIIYDPLTEQWWPVRGDMVDVIQATERRQIYGYEVAGLLDRVTKPVAAPLLYVPDMFMDGSHEDVAYWAELMKAQAWPDEGVNVWIRGGAVRVVRVPYYHMFLYNTQTITKDFVDDDTIIFNDISGVWGKKDLTRYVGNVASREIAVPVARVASRAVPGTNRLRDLNRRVVVELKQQPGRPPAPTRYSAETYNVAMPESPYTLIGLMYDNGRIVTVGKEDIVACYNKDSGATEWTRAQLVPARTVGAVSYMKDQIAVARIPPRGEDIYAPELSCYVQCLSLFPKEGYGIAVPFGYRPVWGDRDARVARGLRKSDLIYCGNGVWMPPIPESIGKPYPPLEKGLLIAELYHLPYATIKTLRTKMTEHYADHMKLPAATDSDKTIAINTMYKGGLMDYPGRADRFWPKHYNYKEAAK